MMADDSQSFSLWIDELLTGVDDGGDGGGGLGGGHGGEGGGGGGGGGGGDGDLLPSTPCLTTASSSPFTPTSTPLPPPPQACWGGLLMGDSLHCTTLLTGGDFRRMFCTRCLERGVTFPADRVRIWCAAGSAPPANTRSHAFWTTRLEGGPRFRVANNTSRCKGPPLLIFEHPPNDASQPPWGWTMGWRLAPEGSSLSPSPSGWPPGCLAAVPPEYLSLDGRSITLHVSNSTLTPGKRQHTAGESLRTDNAMLTFGRARARMRDGTAPSAEG